jgi:hypothetical protein
MMFETALIASFRFAYRRIRHGRRGCAALANTSSVITVHP